MISLLTNTTSLDAQRNLSNTQDALASSVSRLSSGMRINNAADDAAGLGISQTLSANIASMSQAQRNANDSISMTQVAEGSMNSMQTIVSQMRSLAVQSSNATLGSADRSYIQTEFTQLSQEINRISATSSFDGQNLLDGSASAGLTFQIGINNTANDRISMSITKLTTSTLGSTTSIPTGLAGASLSTATNAQKAISSFDKAIQQLSQARSKLGATQNRMQITVQNLSVTQQNLSAANSRITDVDVAAETANLTKEQILSQAGLSVLAQANSLPQAALKLLQ